MAQWRGRATWDSIDRGDWAMCRIRAGRRNREPVEEMENEWPKRSSRCGKEWAVTSATDGQPWEQMKGDLGV